MFTIQSENKCRTIGIEPLEHRRLLSDVYEPNNTLATATDFGMLGDHEELQTLDISPSGDQDFFRFTAASNGSLHVRITFVHLLGDLDMNLYGPAGGVVASSFDSDNDEDIFYEVVGGETYTVNIAGFQGATNSYNLMIDGPDEGTISPDRFEPNDSFAGATDLGALGDRSEEELTIHQPGNDDYFRFTSAASGQADISISFLHAAGDLDLALYNGAEQFLISSESSGNSESIAWELTANAEYYLRVYGFDGATNPEYNLTIDAPGGAPPALDAAPHLIAASDLGQSDTDNITSIDQPAFSGSGAVPGATIHLLAGGVEIGQSVAAGDGTWTVTATSALADGEHSMTVRQSNGSGTSLDSPALWVTIDTMAPTVDSPAFAYLHAPHRVSTGFSEEVLWSLSIDDFELTNLDTSIVITPIEHQLVGGRSEIGVPGLPLLADGNYRLRLLKDGIIDIAGNAMAEDYDFPFFFLAADADHDRDVDTNDFNALASHFNQDIDVDFGNGDFNYDGRVNALDFNTLATNYGTTLTEPSASSNPSLGFAGTPTRADLFGRKSIEPGGKDETSATDILEA